MSRLHDFMGVTGPRKIDICNWTKFSQTCPKNTPKKLPQKKQTTAFLFMLGAFFQIEALQAPFLAKFPLTCSKRTK